MTTLNHNLKAVASAFAALAIVLVMSWTFVDSTRLVRVDHDRQSFVASLSALVR
jgi:hypothetical protein